MGTVQNSLSRFPLFSPVNESILLLSTTSERIIFQQNFGFSSPRQSNSRSQNPVTFACYMACILSTSYTQFKPQQHALVSLTLLSLDNYAWFPWRRLTCSVDPENAILQGSESRVELMDTILNGHFVRCDPFTSFADYFLTLNSKRLQQHAWGAQSSNSRLFTHRYFLTLMSTVRKSPPYYGTAGKLKINPSLYSL